MLVWCDRKRRGGGAVCLVIALGCLAQHAALLPDDNMKVRYPRSIRLKGFDYAQAGAYFVTICTQNRVSLFGDVVNGAVIPNAPGKIVLKAWGGLPDHYPHVRLDAFVVMPNHVHGIVVITDRPDVEAQHAAHLRNDVSPGPAPGSLSTIVRSFKSASTKRVNELRAMPGMPFWKRSYYEHVIRNNRDLERIRAYIVTNPLKWALDRENPARSGRSPKEDALFGPIHAP